MKLVMKFMLILLVVGFTSCRDTAKEEEEANAVIEQIEAVEAEAEEMTDKIDAQAKELEDSLEDLDSI